MKRITERSEKGIRWYVFLLFVLWGTGEAAGSLWVYTLSPAVRDALKESLSAALSGESGRFFLSLLAEELRWMILLYLVGAALLPYIGGGALIFLKGFSVGFSALFIRSALYKISLPFYLWLVLPAALSMPLYVLAVLLTARWGTRRRREERSCVRREEFLRFTGQMAILFLLLSLPSALKAALFSGIIPG